MSSNGNGGDEVVVELRGLTLFTHFGVTEEERKIGQSLVADLWITVPDCAATSSDEVSSTVDYGAVAELIVETFDGRQFQTLERAAAVAAEAVLSSFRHAGMVQIRLAKPEPPIPLAIDEVAVELTRAR